MRKLRRQKFLYVTDVRCNFADVSLEQIKSMDMEARTQAPSLKAQQQSKVSL
jgi:hypothetical protein